MRIWSSKLLEQELAETKLSDWEKTKYLILPLVLSTLVAGPIYLFTPNYGSNPPAFNGLSTFIGNIIMAVVTFYGIRLGYRTNKKIDGKCFIERYTILSVPIFIRCLVIMVPTLFVLMFIFMGIFKLKEIFPLILKVVFPLIIFWFYYLISKSIKRFGINLKNINSNNEILNSA